MTEQKIGNQTFLSDPLKDTPGVDRLLQIAQEVSKHLGEFNQWERAKIAQAVARELKAGWY